jgi:hypothetical protein
MKTTLMMYANKHEGRLPPTLWTLVPEFLSPDEFAALRYYDPDKGGTFDWLYFPRAKLEGLPAETILLAAPSADSLATHRRLVEGASVSNRFPSETEFERLIREQHPPADEAKPAVPAETVPPDDAASTGQK